MDGQNGAGNFLIRIKILKEYTYTFIFFAKGPPVIELLYYIPRTGGGSLSSTHDLRQKRTTVRIA